MPVRTQTKTETMHVLEPTNGGPYFQAVVRNEARITIRVENVEVLQPMRTPILIVASAAAAAEWIDLFTRLHALMREQEEAAIARGASC
jgi:hypothetical protein